ncbi:MAG: hypothetical protein IJ125_07120 [Atopobiaceae bacterium]|nr:hypothetical protein [Atopobiaceae bacterium]
MSTFETSHATIQPGYSTRINSPEFQLAMKSSNKTFAITSLLTALLLAPLLMLAVSFFSKEPIQNLIIPGLFVELVILIFVAVSAVKRAAGKTWDGEVIEQFIDHELTKDSDRNDEVYVTVIRKESGKKFKHKEHTLHPVFDYLETGDEVRYHPKLNFPFEKYDKSADSYLVCPFCCTKQDISADSCANCKKPLLK